MASYAIHKVSSTQEKSMPSRNVSLPEALDLFVDTTIRTGRYDNASEVIRAGLRLLEQQEKENQEKLVRLNAAIAEGLASGVAEEGEVVFARLEQRIRDRAAA